MMEHQRLLSKILVGILHLDMKYQIIFVNKVFQGKNL